MFAWHAIEEMEHRDVAFDVMKDVAKTPEWLRQYTLLITTLLMFGFTIYRANVMLKHDGFSPLQRLQMNIRAYLGFW